MQTIFTIFFPFFRNLTKNRIELVAAVEPGIGHRTNQRLPYISFFIWNESNEWMKKIFITE